MKLLSVRVQNYRSIVDSELVPIEDRVTVIIGKNEQGKTTFLKGVSSFSPNRKYMPNDLPQHLRADLENQEPSSIPIVTAYFSFEHQDNEQLKNILEDINSISKIKITRYFDGHYSYCSLSSNETENEIIFKKPDIENYIESIKAAAVQLKSKFSNHASRQGNFAPHKAQAEQHIDAFISSDFSAHEQIDNLIKTLITALTGVPGQDEPIQTDISNTAKEIQALQFEIKRELDTDQTRVFWKVIPKFVYHSTSLDRIPNEVNLAAFISNPDGVSKGMSNLCSAAGLSVQKIQSLASTSDVATRESYEDHYRAAISGGINSFWSQEHYTVYFRIEKDRLSVSISDENYSRRIAPSDRSEGFQWFLSFYCTLLNEGSTGEKTILLLDNPGLELHADGQRDIKNFLEDNYSASAQVMFVTHSPAMLDPYKLEQVRRVELLEDMAGTKVRKLNTKAPEELDLLEPVRSAIGASLISSLAFNKMNILTEGAADKPILEAGVLGYKSELKESVLINGGISEGKELLPMFFERANIRYVIYLDSDSGGRNLGSALVKAGVPKSKIANLKELLNGELYNGKDFELEDIISRDLYHAAVLETYTDKIVNAPEEDNPKRTNYYEKAYKEKYDIGFNKKRVAETLKQLIITGKGDEKSKENLEKILTGLHEALTKKEE
jgi:predicted ATP-dependent endonuclease of OLD family